MKIVACLFFCLILCSCSYEEHHGCAAGKRVAMKSTDHSDDYSGCAGPPPPPDDTKPSSEELWFNAEGGIDSITTEGENWRISDYVVAIKDTVIISYVDREIIKIEAPWFNVYKPNKKKIIFSINRNETGKEREFSIYLVGNHYYYIDINIKQSAE